MTEHQSGQDRHAKLRQLAEQRSGEQASQNSPPISEQDSQRLVHELQVHQIELELQNEELRITQEQLSESLEKYTNLYEFSPVGYVTSNTKGRILEANLTFAGQLGIERGRLINTALTLYASAPDRATFRAHLDQVFRNAGPHACNLRMERRNGPELHVQLNSIRALHTDGSQSCWTSVTDISTRVLAENDLANMHQQLEKMVIERTAALSESEKNFKNLFLEFQTLLNAISDTLILLSPTMEVLWSNVDTQPLVDQELSSPIKQYCDKLFHDHQSSLEDCPARRCFATGQKETLIITFKGTVFDIRAFPINEEGAVSGVLLLISDISDKIAMQAEAIQATHLASLGELAAGVAHEINNPITGIINYGQILINECSPDGLEKDIGTRIVKEGERIGRIVKTLLAYAQVDRRKEKRACRVSDILLEAIVLTQAQIRKEGIELNIVLPDDLPPVKANFQQIQQCMINIINNARYALNEKYVGRHENKRLDITGKSVIIDGHPYVRILFHDRGVGIHASDLSVLTKPFYSTKPFGKGTGLGLSITQKIITDHNGNLLFESIQGECTKTIIELPVHLGEAEAET